MTSWLHEQRIEAVRAILRDGSARKVLDLGCGHGDLLVRLATEREIDRIVGVDLSLEALERLRTRLRTIPGEASPRIDLIQGSLLDLDRGFGDFDAAVLIETIEHLEPDRLSALERVVFGELRPEIVVMTTPNADFNPRLGVPSHRFRHPDHRFEWGRAKFRGWAEGVAQRNVYRIVCSDIGGALPFHGGPSQIAHFTRGGDGLGS
jgi:small RNA 2'-O-methyltransferase